MTERNRVIGDMSHESERPATPSRTGRSWRPGDNEAWLRVAIDLLGLAPFSWDIVNAKLDWDERLKRLWGLAEDAKVDCDLFLSAIHPEDRPKVQEDLARTLDPAGERTYAGEFRVIGVRDRVERWVCGRGQAFFEGGRATRFVGFVVEITERKRAEEVLLQSEAEFRALFELSGVGQVQTDAAALRFVRVNRKFCEITGYSPEELASITASDLTHPDDRAASDALWARVRSGELPEFSIEKRYVRKDGSPVWVHVSANLLRDANGRPWLTAGLIEDITERRKAEDAVRTSEERLRLALKAGDMGAWEWDLDTGELVWDRSLYDLIGLDHRTRPTLERFFSLLHADDRPRAGEAVASILSGDESALSREFRIVRADGVMRWLRSAGTIQHTATGQRRAIGVYMDVTESKARDEHLLLLMRELAHRSKNQLAMVQAIARQTTRQSESFEAFDRQFSARIQALAECNDILMKRDWQGAPITDIVHSQMKVFGAYQSQIETRGAPITLSSAATQNVGLALHELATNALKYGALSRPAGKVTIGWEVVFAPEQKLRIVWREEGGPPARWPERKGFGSVVLERATPAALNGTGRLDYSPEGLRWELEIPYRHVVTAADTHIFSDVNG